MATETELERMLIRLVGDASDYVKMLRDARKATEQASKEVEKAATRMENIRFQLNIVGSSMRSFGMAASRAGLALKLGVTLPILGFATAAFRAASRMEQLKLGMTAITGSAEETERQLLQLKEIAKLPGLGLEEAVQGAQSLQAVGFEADKAMEVLQEFGNVVATAGFGRFELQRVIFQLGQMKSVGKVLTADLRPIITTVPQIGTVMEEVFGTKSPEALAKAGIGAEEFIEKLVEGLKQLPRVAGGTANTMENLSDTIKEAMVEVGGVILEMVLPSINALATAVKRFTEIWKSMNPFMQKAIIILAGIAAAIGPVVLGIGLLSTAFGFLTATAIPAAITGLTAVVAALGPLGIVAAAGAAAFALLAVSMELKAISEASRDIDAFTRRMKNSIANMTDATELEKAQEEVAILQMSYERLRGELDKEFGKGINRFFGRALTGPARKLDAEVTRLGEMLVAAQDRVVSIRRAMADAGEKTAAQLNQVKFDQLLSGVVDKVKRSLEELTVEDLKREFMEVQAAFERGEISSKEFKASVEEINKSLEKAVVSAERLEIKEREDMIRQMEQLEQRGRGFVDSLQMQAETFGMTARQAQIYKLSLDLVGVVSERTRNEIIKNAEALDKQLTEMEAAKKLTEEGKQVTEQFLTPQERRAEQIERFTRLHEAGAITTETFQRAMASLGKEIDKATRPLRAVGKDTAEFQELLAQAASRTGQTARDIPKDPFRGFPTPRRDPFEDIFGGGRGRAIAFQERRRQEEIALYGAGINLVRSGATALTASGNADTLLKTINDSIVRLIEVEQSKEEVVLQPLNLNTASTS